MRMMARGGTQQDRMRWLTGDLKSEPAKGEVFYWTGCTMYYDAFFPDFQVKTLEGTRAAVRLLNKLGVTPVVSKDERCCGHDLLWNGDRENFELLARHNVKLVAESGASVLVVSCAECLRTWKMDYAPFIQGTPPRIVHITEYLAERLPELKFKSDGKHRVTFQDPCRLGRHLGIYHAPRQMLAALPGVELTEMRHSGPAATCCAGGTWSNCDRFAKQIQVGRLREARATGAEFLVTACPKCQVHFRCAMKDPKLGGEIQMEIRDVAEVVLEAIV
jgi:Fe-S oxidoreductase